MKKNARIGSVILGALVLVSMFAAFVPRTPGAAGGPGSRSLVDTVTSALVTSAPTLDGQGTDAAWNQATQITITGINGANSAGPVDAHLKSVYVGDTVYFWAHWADSQDSRDRFPWFYNTTSSKWEQHGNTTSGDEDNYYEDKFAIIWDINNSVAGFGGATGSGPAVTCHSPKHYTNSGIEKADIWHWKRVRSEPVGQVDDQYMDNNTIAKDAGRHSDPQGTPAGGYKDNNQTLAYEDDPLTFANVPKAWVPGAISGSDDYYWLKISDLGSRAFNFTKVWKSNGTLMDEVGNVAPNSTHVPGILLAPFTGDRGNVTSGANWNSGFWTVEFSRKLVTGSQFDLQFNDTGPSAVYYFSMATFNNAQIDHNIGMGDVYALKFQQPNRAPSTPTITWVPASPNAGDVVTFTAVSNDPDSDTLAYTWDFGDQTPAGTGASPTHTYASNGTFTVGVTVNDGHGHSVTGTNTITVNPKTVVTEQQGLSTTTIVIIIVVIVLIVVILAVLMGRRKKSAPEMMPPQEQP